MKSPFVFPIPTDHTPGHWHEALMPLYGRLFKTLHDEAGSVLEIGCDGGGGITSYANYFSSFSTQERKYVSCDISPRPSSLGNDIEHHQTNAYSPSGVGFLGERAPYALIVEDGDHQISSQKFFCENYLTMLSPQGIAIIEDLQRPEYVTTLHSSLPPEFFGFAVDLRHYGRYDNLVFVAQRL